MTRTSKLAAVLFAFFIGVVGTPEKFKSRTTARGMLVNPSCQSELDDMNAANAALLDAQGDLASAQTYYQVAQQAQSICQMQSPGNCQQEAADVAAANAGVAAAQQIVGQAGTAAYNAASAYYACLYGN